MAIHGHPEPGGELHARPDDAHGGGDDPRRHGGGEQRDLRVHRATERQRSGHDLPGQAGFTITDNDVQATTYAITPNPATVARGGRPPSRSPVGRPRRRRSTPAQPDRGLCQQRRLHRHPEPGRDLYARPDDGHGGGDDPQRHGGGDQRDLRLPRATQHQRSGHDLSGQDDVHHHRQRVQATTYAITPNPVTVGEGAGARPSRSPARAAPAETIYASTTRTRALPTTATTPPS